MKSSVGVCKILPDGLDATPECLLCATGNVNSDIKNMILDSKRSEQCI